MSLRRVLAAGFKHRGTEILDRTELVAAIALDRGWFSPAEVRTLIDRGLREGELYEEDGRLAPTFAVAEVTIPASFRPSDDLLNEQSPFEQLIDRLEGAGHERHEAVAAINEVQSTLELTSDGAALVYAHEQGLDVTTEARTIRRDLEENEPP